MLARASAREREVAVRLSLGASRSRLIRQLLSESILLALIGACCGALLAQWLSRFLVAYINSRGRIYLDLALDWRVLGFTAGVAMLTSIIFGLAPAFRAPRSRHLASGFLAGSRCWRVAFLAESRQASLR
jgi:ABC-type antimicrobial peptide transport system permease subunit